MSRQAFTELDFTNMEELIDWIDSITDGTLNRPSFVAMDVVELFETHGYMRDFTPPNKDVNDPDEYGRWIIAQALTDLACYRGDCIRGVISKFTAKWKILHGA